MQYIHTHFRPLPLAIGLAVGLVALAFPLAGHTATADIELQLRPHCMRSYGDETTTDCAAFSAEDPETLRSSTLSEGDELDIDIVLRNPSRQEIRSVRAWLNYDPSVLEGVEVSPTSLFPTTTPDEEGFTPEEGLIKLEVQSLEENRPATYWVPVARVRLTVRTTVPVGTVLSFFDVDEDGHTFVLVNEGDGEPALDGEPASLLIPMQAAESPQTSSSSSSASIAPSLGNDDSNTETPNDSQNSLKGEGAVCTANNECSTGLCQNGLCRDPNTRVPNGGACVLSAECSSNFCVAGTCRDPNDREAQRTAFSLQQVRNVRVTTESTTVYLGWDPLESSILKGYNVYYGSTSGRYIQRKTIPAVSPSVTIRNLPLNEQYYFAVRAINEDDEESAFSQEVGIVIGDPTSASSPLLTDINNQAPADPIKPTASVVNVPGETGAGSLLVLFAILSAVIGTTIAARRQMNFSHSTQPYDL